MRTISILIVAFFTACAAVYPVSAALTVTIGFPVAVYADPSDVVIELDNAGNCGSKYFHIQRSNPNFKEMTAVALTALANGKKLNLFVSGCLNQGDRNILDHGGVFR